MNKLIILGNVGKDPEKKYLPDGTALVEFSLAVPAGKKNGHPISQWYKCQSWNEKQQGTILEYVKKGNKLVVMGTPKFSAYVNKEGKPSCDVSVSIGEFSFAGSKQEDESSDNSHDETSQNTSEAKEDANKPKFNAPAPVLAADDIPF